MIYSISVLICFLVCFVISQAVVQYMAEIVERRNVKTQPIKQKKSWAQICCFSRSNKRKHNDMGVMDYVKA